MKSAETATAQLREEHRLILQVVGVLDTIVDRAGHGGPLDLEGLGDCIAFFRLFTDACHHGKEEGLLFPELESRGLPADSGPIAVMLEEHRRGRDLVARMGRALEGATTGEEAARKDLEGAARDYADLIRSHISKEDGVLFEMADQLVVDHACRELCAAYGIACEERFEGRTKEELESLAARLTRRYEGG